MEHTQTSGDEPGAEMIAARAATIAPRRHARNVRPYLLAVVLVPASLIGLLILTSDGDWERVVVILLCASPFLALLGAWALYAYKIVDVDAAGFHVRDLWGTKSELPWERVAAVHGVGGAFGFVLSDKASDTRVPLLDASGGEELLALVRHVRPDLWQRFDPDELTNGEHKGRNWLFDQWRIFVTLLWAADFARERLYALTAVFLVLAVVAAGGLMTEVIAVRLEPNGLRVRWRGRQRFVPRADVVGFLPRGPGGGVRLVRRNGRAVDLGHMEGGTAYALELLRAWAVDGGQ